MPLFMVTLIPCCFLFSFLSPERERLIRGVFFYLDCTEAPFFLSKMTQLFSLYGRFTLLHLSRVADMLARLAFILVWVESSAAQVLNWLPSFSLELKTCFFKNHDGNSLGQKRRTRTILSVGRFPLPNGKEKLPLALLSLLLASQDVAEGGVKRYA